ncbi:hypothetical protein NDU88_007780, partial [Pleurodeles waltl]
AVLTGVFGAYLAVGRRGAQRQGQEGFVIRPPWCPRSSWDVLRWRLNGSDIDLRMDYRYSSFGGSLVVMNPKKNWDAGIYQCLAINSHGAILSREARLQFAYLENFKTKTRSTVSVREGQGVVLLCGPPPHV